MKLSRRRGVLLSLVLLCGIGVVAVTTMSRSSGSRAPEPPLTSKPPLAGASELGAEGAAPQEPPEARDHEPQPATEPAEFEFPRVFDHDEIKNPRFRKMLDAADLLVEIDSGVVYRVRGFSQERQAVSWNEDKALELGIESAYLKDELLAHMDDYFEQCVLDSDQLFWSRKEAFEYKKEHGVKRHRVYEYRERWYLVPLDPMYETEEYKELSGQLMAIMKELGLGMFSVRPLNAVELGKETP